MIDESIVRAIAELKWARDQLIALCEATEDDPILYGTPGEYARGRIMEAKGIRNAMAETINERIRELNYE